MNVSITTFSNPFSFFCKPVGGKDEQSQLPEPGDRFHVSKTEVSDLNHGQYVTVMWNNQWTRGVVSVENRIMIWLIDHGIYIRPDEKTFIMDLPANLKKLPTKVFEASIHGVSPVDKVLSDDCEIKSEVTMTWNKGATERVLTLLETASEVIFIPIAIMSTKANDIVLGDVYLKIGNRHVNIISELETWPVFLERNKEYYIKNMPTYYAKSHRKHRGCMLKPLFPDFELPTMILATTLVEYNAICAKGAEAPSSEVDEESSSQSSHTDDSSTVMTCVVKVKNHKSKFELPEALEEKYSSLWITLGGEEHNVLELVKKKLEDFRINEKYKNRTGFGRATSRKRRDDNEE